MSNKDLKYMPPPTIPSYFEKAFNVIVPINEATGKRNIRWVWGCDATEILDGETQCRYMDVDGIYVGRPRWVLEGWQPPTIYDRDQWDVEILGPFPEQGVWDFLAYLETPDGGFMNLGEGALNVIRRWRHYQNLGKEASIKKLLADRCQRKVMQERRLEANKKKRQKEFVAEFVKIAAKGETASVANQTSKDQWQKTDSGLILMPN